MSVTGGPSEGVYVVSQEELDSGAFRVAPGPALRVAGITPETRGVMGGPATPVYIVSDPSARGIIGGAAMPVSNLTGIRSPVHDLAIPIYVESDDGQFAPPAPVLDLTAPNDLAAVAISTTEIDLTWTDTAPDATGYKIERAPAGTGTWAQIDDIAAPATGYSDTGLSPGTAYDYRIRAYAGVTNGDYSNTATDTTELSALYQSLLLGEFWPLDEASGNRAGAINGLTLINENTVVSATGHVYANAASFFQPNGEYLSRASETTLQWGNIDAWIAAWVYPGELPTENRMIAAKDNNTTGQREYAFFVRSSTNGSTFAMEVFRATDSSRLVASTTYGAALVNTWQFVIAWHDATEDTVNISVNAGAVNSFATGGALQAASAAQFRIGARQYTGAEGFFTGRIGPVIMGKGYLPDADDRDFMFNAGAGRTLAEMFSYAG